MTTFEPVQLRKDSISSKISFPDIKKYSDYRQYLNDFYNINKDGNTPMSYRYLSMKLGWNISYMNDVLKKRRNLNISKALEFSKFAGFNTVETERFIYLVLKDNENITVKDFCEKKLDSEFTTPESVENEIDFIFNDLRKLAVHEVLCWANGKISKSKIRDLLFTFNLSEKDINEAIEFLIDKKIISIESDGIFKILEKEIFTQMDDEKRDYLAHIEYAKNFERFCMNRKGPGFYHSSFLQVPLNQVDEVKDKIICFINWIYSISKESLESNRPPKDFLIYQFDLNMSPIIDKEKV